jgi:chemotaxis protein methyltransferase CheR
LLFRVEPHRPIDELMTPSLLAGARRRVREPSSFGAGQLDALSRACGIPLRAYRPDHVAERIERAIDREGLHSVADLPALLRRDPDARTRLRRAVAISVTGRFRDPQQYDLLESTILPELTAERGSLRVWSAGCATGLELLGVAALLERLGALDRAQLLGSDLLEENIETARGSLVASVSPRVAARTRWEVRDLTSDGTPGARFDLILCRNVGIYLEPASRDRLMRTLAGALTRGGVLLLGRSERLTDPAHYGLEPYADHAYRSPR